MDAVVAEGAELSIDSTAWRDFVGVRADALVFHQPGWAHLLAECYGFRPFALALTDAAGRPTAGIPVLEVKQLGRLRWVSQPFTDVSPPLVDPGQGEPLVQLLDTARREAGVRTLEVRGPFPGVAAAAAAAAVTHTVALGPDPDVVLAATKRTVRQKLRAAERAGLIVRRADSEQDLTEVFYRLQLDTRRRLGVPIQPRRWYRLLWRRVVEAELGFVLLAYDGPTAVAGGVFLTWNGVVTAKYSASSAAAWSLHPNNVIFWEAIRYGCVNGFRAFDFGRTEAAAASLRQFKLSWGAVEEPLPYTMIGDKSSNGRAIGLGLASSVIRRSPRLVTRVLGEVLYRYAA